MDDQPRVGTRLDLTVSFHVGEIQEATSTATGGTWRITTAGQTTHQIPYDCTWRDVERALQACAGIGPGGVSCWGGPFPAQPIRIHLVEKRQVPPLTVEATALTGGTVTVATVQDGGPIVLDSNPVVAVVPAGNLGAVEHLGGGVYRAVFVPAVVGSHKWTATGASTAHGPVAASGGFTTQ